MVDRKVLGAVLAISTWIISTGISVGPLLVMVLIETNKKMEFTYYIITLVFDILQSLLTIAVLYGVVMVKAYIKLRIYVALSLELEMVLFNGIILSIGEDITFAALFITIPILLVMWYAIYMIYKKLIVVEVEEPS